MKRITTLLLTALTFCLALTSCNNDDEGYYVSISGEGALTIDYKLPIFLYRMVYFGSSTTQQLYIMGGNAYVNSNEEFGGRGAAIKLTLPNDEQDTSLNEQSFTIDNEDYSVEYTSYINFDSVTDKSAVDESDFTALSSGTAIIRRSADLYDIRILGNDSNGDNVIISYRGYLYRSFWNDLEE